MTQVSALDDSIEDSRIPGRPDGGRHGRGARARGALVVAVVLVVALGVAVRTFSRSALWLDETLSVNIARLPLPELFDALRQDGSPPLYYLLLHGWMAVFGTTDGSVRLLSSLFSVASLPVAYHVGRRFAGPRCGWAALVLVAVNPFLVRYATETRMYALVALLTLLFAWAALRVAHSPTAGRWVLVSLLGGIMLLTNYWTAFTLAAAGLWVVAEAIRRRRPRLIGQLALAGVGSLVVFSPWLGGFLFQLEHTGTPWADRTNWTAFPDTLRDWGGGQGWVAGGMSLVVLALVVLAFVPWRRRDDGPELRTVSIALLVGSFGALLIGVVISWAIHSGYAIRYTSAMVVPALLLAAVGAARLSGRLRLGALVVVGLLGLGMSVPLPFADDRTQGRDTAELIAAGAGPGDLVLFCPDQIAPDVNRYLPADLDQAVYPTLGPPERVDWVDYTERNESASVVDIAVAASQRATGRIWLVTSPGYRTYGGQCESLERVLGALRPGGDRVQDLDDHFFERQAVTEFPARTTTAS
ncbi:glycosyltransferase family 39 protein [Nakamurella leprariae]|uniref:Glycosyltransferase family 39 protein n=1 Tax=Nakamurella leprariae TaxID=2803911 RepID=A0A939BWY4_9ACTN|nr:glycosyltransferase family 39 protein [Nakamurella leprariae]MBM9468008.1 glycosyltransferase family 39 protein [Nakamurella leprariae]